ncbi:hypothetical protein V6N11_061397 [Hibiscus sabdariffa]|uniref:Uncharacterized protein n=1 Tax=Hibiscus sabdariffa TaxID=183260 RepID=A0ABR2NVP6_9ROSI
MLDSQYHKQHGLKDAIPQHLQSLLLVPFPSQNPKLDSRFIVYNNQASNACSKDKTICRRQKFLVQPLPKKSMLNANPK